LPDTDSPATTDRPDFADPVATVSTRYVAFLSYSHADRPAAAALHRFLENYRVPPELVGRSTRAGVIPARLRPIFRDREDLTAAADLTEEIQAALAASGALIVLCSQTAAASRWVDNEVARFKALHGEARVFAAVIYGTPFASNDPARAADECFPPALRRRGAATDAPRAEPLAADLRRSGDGMQAGRLKLVAGLIGVPLDELVHRDARRRQRRTLAVVVALLLGMALTTALAVSAVRARNEAVRQRAEAEGLIEFMVGDLRAKLEPVGRLGAMDSLLARALDYYRHQDETSLDPESLGRRARVVRVLGEIEAQRGDLDAALHSFETAAASTAELLARDRDNPQRIFDHAQNVFFIGNIALRRGNFAVAEREFRDYGHYADRLIAIDPGNPAWQAEVGYANNTLAVMLFQQGRNAEAAEGFARALAIQQSAAARKPGDTTEQLYVADAYAWVALVRERLGRLDAAAAANRAALAVADAVLADDRGNGVALHSRLTANDGLARIAALRRDFVAARRYSDAAVADIDPLVASDATNVEWIYDAAIAQVARGDVLIASGDTAGATRALDAAHRYATLLTAHDSGVTKWRLLHIRERLVRSRIELASGQAAVALATANAAAVAIGGLPGNNRDTGEERYLLGHARWQAAAAMAASGDRAGARAEWRSLVDDRPRDAANEEPRMIALRASAYAALGNSGAEAALVARLRTLGWPYVNFRETGADLG
jgi:eukaryotic-like serine/threonine-protein kinase